MRIFAILYCLVASGSLLSQQYDVQQFQRLESYGTIPDDFLKLTTEKIDDYKSLYTDQYQKSKDFIVKSYYNIDELLLSGRVAFGDPATEYINKVAGVVLKNRPDLLKKLKFYNIKLAQFNAASSPQGIVLVNTGTFAYLENEAQLAYVLCHEIAHYLKEHSFNSYTENKKALKGKGIYGSMSIDQRIDSYFSYKHEKEMEADSVGISLFLQTGYDPSEISKTLHALHYYYLPFGNKPFNIDFFNRNGFTIPAVYFKNSVTPISGIENESDEYQTHPNILKRKEAVARILGSEKKEGKKYIISENSFRELSRLCQFESLRLHILHKNYTQSVYTAYLLLQDFPGNEFLEISIAKALYGLAKFRNAEEFHLVTKPFSKIEGESQQLYYFFRQITPEQLNTLAIRYILDLKPKYPGIALLEHMETELIEELVAVHEVNFERFNGVPKEIVSPSMSELVSLNQEDILAWKNKCSDFYLNAFCTFKDDTCLIRKFSLAEKKHQSGNDEMQLTWKEKEKLKLEYEERVRRNGLPMKYQKALIIDPLYIDLNNDSEKSVASSEKYKMMLDEVVTEFQHKLQINVVLLSMRELEKGSVSAYNQLCSLKEWRDELLTDNNCKILPLCGTYHSNAADNKGIVICFPVIIRDNGIEYYKIAYYDYQTGDLLFKNTAKLMSFASAKELFSKDLMILTKNE
jgi:hypothetical protein